MPDNDVVPRRIRPRWRMACQLMIEGHEPAFVGATIDRALAETVREVRLPSPLPLVQAARDAIVLADTAAYEAARAEYKASTCGLELADDVLEALTVLCEVRREDLIGQPEHELTHDLVADALRRTADRALCGPEDVAEAMIAKGSSFDEVDHRQRVCLDSAQYEKLAAQIVAGNADRVRKPPSRVERPSLAALLDQEVT